MKKYTKSIVAGLLLLASCRMPQKESFSYEPEGECYAIPRLESIVIDGHGDDWQGRGSTGTLHVDYTGKWLPAGDFSVTFHLGWNDTALLVMAQVADDTVMRSGITNKKGESIEFFLLDKKGGKNKIQYVIQLKDSLSAAPVEVTCWDHRGSRKLAGTAMNISVAASLTPDGYCVETAIPFRYVGITASTDQEVGFEIKANDVEKNEPSATELSWSPLRDAYLNNFACQRLRLTENEAPPIETFVKAFILDRDTAKVIVYAPREKAGCHVTLRDTVTVFAMGELKAGGDFSKAEFSFPVKDSMYYPMAVFTGNSLAGVIDLCIANMEFNKKERYPHEEYVRLLLRRQSLHPAPPRPILFIGHSMLRYWHTFDDDMEGFPAINRAFGGSRAEQTVFWYDKLVKPYHPRAIVYFEGANDYKTGVPVKIFTAHVKTFIEKAHADFPDCKIFIISPDIRSEKPEYNAAIKKMIQQYKSFVEYIDMEGYKQKMGEENYRQLLLPDHTHWNADGYKRFAPLIREKLKAFKDL